MDFSFVLCFRVCFSNLGKVYIYTNIYLSMTPLAFIETFFKGRKAMTKASPTFPVVTHLLSSVIPCLPTLSSIYPLNYSISLVIYLPMTLPLSLLPSYTPFTKYSPVIPIICSDRMSCLHIANASPHNPLPCLSHLYKKVSYIKYFHPFHHDTPHACLMYVVSRQDSGDNGCMNDIPR